jgi:putative protease
MKKLELLAPAGSIESMYAAVQAGADAIYLGGSKFSARAYASNFDNENMTKAVEYCHLYNVKVYVTINTILKENELQEALEYAKFLYRIGVDALIIQDLGFANLMKKNLPSFELHASTQMTIHNVEGASFLKELGFKRIVLSRELSLKEIKHISIDLGVETEIFIHGALCVCYSGQCLMSSMIGGRSGNRGRCAQPCRLPYTIINRKNLDEKKGYILSPKDICTIESIKEIVDSGTTSLKIEGRMKRPEYVAGVVQSYRKAIDGISIGGKKINIEEENKKLLQLFNREGFSKAYLFGNTGKDMMAYSFPKNTGIELGKVRKDLTLVLNENISLKDGIRNGEGGFTISKIIQNGKEVKEAFKGDRVKLLPSEYTNGNTLYKMSDLKFTKELEEIYKNPYERKVELRLETVFKMDKPMVLTTIYEDKHFTVEGPHVQKALKRPLDKERIIESLSKAGDTPFKFTDIIFSEFEEGFLPVSAINEVRSELINKVESYLIGKNEDEEKIEKISIQSNKDKLQKLDKLTWHMPKTIIYANNELQLKAFMESDFKCVAINPFGELSFTYLSNLRNKDKKVYLKIPNIIKIEFEYIRKAIEERLEDIEGIITSNLGIISNFTGRVPIIGDYKLNIFNSCALDFYKDFIDGGCLSVELNRKEIKDIAKKSQVPLQVLVYGKVELMVSEYCAIGSTFGEKSSSKNCNGVCKNGDFVLKDRKGEEFVLKTDKFCRSYVYNNVPNNLIFNMDELRAMNIEFFRIDFIDESYEETKEILQAIENEKWEDDFSKFTRGHYRRGVE